MYPVSQDYLTKLYSGSIRRRIRGFVDNIPFTETDLLSGSFSYVDKCINSADIKLGGVFVGQLECAFLPSFATNINRGTWRGRVLTIDIGLYLGTENNEEIWEYVPLKPYIIDEATWSKAGVSVTAYDSMYFFDKPCNIDTTNGTLYELMGLACKACEIPLGMTEAEFNLLPNAGETVYGLYPDNDIETWRDFVSWIACTCCGFATIDRNGYIVIRTWHTEPDAVIDINDRYTGGSWSDFTTYYTGLSVVRIEDEVTEYISVFPDTGLTMNLGSNPLLQYGTKETHSIQLNNILQALQNFVYTPFTSQSLIDPFLDLGDVIEYTNGLAGDSSICCVHKLEFKYSKGVKLTGFGKNPALFGARSKNDKNLSGLMAKTSENELITYTFTNAADIELAEDVETEILNIRFGTINPKIIKLLTEVQLDVEAKQEGDVVQCTVGYYLDDDKLTYSPVTTWDNDGNHLLNLMYWLQNLEGGRVYEWAVTLELSGGTATISKEWVHSILEAQGLVATDEWDGVIEAEDSVVVSFNGGFVPSITSEDVGFTWYDVEAITASDIVSATFGGGFIVSITDSANIITQKDIYKLVSEDGTYQLISEDGEYHVESEE